MPSYIRPYGNQAGIHAEEESFFAKPISRLLSLTLLILSSVLLYVVYKASPSAEDMIKLGLLTIPVTGYMLYRSFLKTA
jgi:hypothetical protein